MATDIYLQIDGIKGESTDDKHTRIGLKFCLILSRLERLRREALRRKRRK